MNSRITSAASESKALIPRCLDPGNGSLTINGRIRNFMRYKEEGDEEPQKRDEIQIISLIPSIVPTETRQRFKTHLTLTVGTHTH